MFLHSSIALLICLVVSISGLKIECIYQRNSWTAFGSINECLTESVSSATPHGILTEIVTGRVLKSFFIHDKDKVQSLYVNKSPSFHYIPSGIAENFKNLKVLIIFDAGLKVLTKSNLQPLSKLKMLNIEQTQLESLEEDLFSFNRGIESINLKSNRIKHVAVDILKPLTNLREVYFAHNPCIHKSASNRQEFEEIEDVLRQNCPPVDEHKLPGDSTSGLRLGGAAKSEALDNDDGSVKKVKLKFDSSPMDLFSRPFASHARIR